MSDLVHRLRHMPSSINDALRTMDDAADRIEQLEAALTLIAGSSADRLQALQAAAALDNIGAKAST